MLTSKEVRSAYLNFFESKGHLIHPSDSLVPDDPSLLYTAAGMVQFKPYFMGEKIPSSRRMVTSQKCMRTDDIEEVGDSVHHTFFEMLGNFSFGDYFKKEAITWAWEFLTQILKINSEYLWTSVYVDDPEAYDIWTKDLGFPGERVVKIGAHKNYWPADAPLKGPNGVCGPCNEIFIDVRPEEGYPADPVWSISHDSTRFVEIWNLVFTQFDRQDNGDLLPLPFKNIDTGMGLERAVAILNGCKSNYDTDLFMPIINKIENMSGKKYGAGNEDYDRCFRVIADHIRSAVFAMSDGVMPSNAGRGYVLRRLIRNAVLKGRKLGLHSNFMTGIIPCVVDMMGSVYPELIERATYSEKVMTAEEDKFRNTLESGLERLELSIKEAKSLGDFTIKGDVAFSLYDTFGFPLELTLDLAKEENISVDVAGFNEAMDEQRTRAQMAGMFTDVMGAQTEEYIKELEKMKVPKTEFTGYGNMHDDSVVLAVISNGKSVDCATAGEEVFIITAKTPFYGEMGGQVGDKGIISCGNTKIVINDTVRNTGYFLHVGKVEDGSIKRGDQVSLSVSSKHRMDVERNHSATHILHSAIQMVFGEHAVQSGSYVSSTRLRFDYSHFQTPSKEELSTIENIVNETILSDMKVSTIETSIDKARELGAKALFGEKYGSCVRVVDIFGFSKEFCGGTHVAHSSQIGLFKILSESSIGAGLRRIEAITGRNVLDYTLDLEEKISDIANITNAQLSDVVNSVNRLVENNKIVQTELDKMRDMAVMSQVDDMILRSILIKDVRYVAAMLEITDADVLKKAADTVVEKLKNGGAVTVAGSKDGKIVFICKASDNVVKRGVHCGKIVKAAASVAGGGGGGRADFAQAGGKNADKILAAMDMARRTFEEQLK